MKTAIVTGASGNLGKAIVQKFLDEGFLVFGISRHEPGIAHPHFKFISLDLADEQKCHELVKQITDECNQIDVAVLTAGGFAMGALTDTRWNDFVDQLNLNFRTTYNIAQPVFTAMMKEGKGRIFLTGARPGSDMRYSKGLAAYGLSKSLIFRLAEQMNEEAKGSNVVTAVIVPSTIDTPQNRQAMPNAEAKKWVKPEEIAGIVYFHCTDAADCVRETVIKVYKNG